MPTITDMAPAHWVRDIQRLNAAIPVQALVYDGEWVGIDPSLVNSEVIRLYGELSSMGYVMGWLR